MTNRPSWDVYFMSLAHAAATRSTCSRLQVGAVLVSDRQVISTGFNGAPSRVKHCVHRDDRPCRVSAHAELNALVFASSAEHCSLYVTHAPCLDCSKYIINAGVWKVFYAKEYRSTEGVELMRSVGIEVVQLEKGA